MCGVCGRQDVCLYGFVCTGVANVCVCEHVYEDLSVSTHFYHVHAFVLHRSLHCHMHTLNSHIEKHSNTDMQTHAHTHISLVVIAGLQWVWDSIEKI